MFRSLTRVKPHVGVRSIATTSQRWQAPAKKAYTPRLILPEWHMKRTYRGPLQGAVLDWSGMFFLNFAHQQYACH